MTTKKGRLVRRLTPAQVASLPPGAISEKTGKPRSKLYPDGNHLYLRVKASGSRSWAFVYRWREGGQDKQPEIGLGKAGKGGVSLADARAKALEGSTLLSQKPKVDPRTAWGLKLAAGGETFGAAFERYYALNKGRWDDEHARQWRKTIETYCQPLLATPVDQIDTAAVLGVLEPIWTRIPETASRVRSRIEIVLNFANDADEPRSNPARWRGHLAFKLPDPKGGRSNFAALPYADVPGFAARLRAVEGVTARALEFLLLTATRSAEGRGAQWSEIDLNARLWTIPLARMKTGKKPGRRPHRVPLSDRAMEILAAMNAVNTGAFVFPGRPLTQPIGDKAVLALAKELGAETVHGLRSSFRDFVGEETDFSRETAEFALSHSIRGVEEKYRRGDGFERRRGLMEAWSRYCASEPHDAAANDAPRERERMTA